MDSPPKASCSCLCSHERKAEPPLLAACSLQTLCAPTGSPTPATLLHPTAARPAGTILEETRSLHEILKDEERDFEDQLVWSATYDPPQKLLKR